MQFRLQQCNILLLITDSFTVFNCFFYHFLTFRLLFYLPCYIIKCRVAQKVNHVRIDVKLYLKPANKARFFRKTSTRMLLFAYFICDLIFDVISYNATGFSVGNIVGLKKS